MRLGVRLTFGALGSLRIPRRKASRFIYYGHLLSRHVDHPPRTTTANSLRFASSASTNRLVSPLEKRISEIPIERYRNFCIVAHVDHGKSTLSDRLLELTGTIQPGGKKQVLDKLDVERERGITVKAQTCSMIYKYEGEDYLLHLVDTPGHVDFRAEVSRSYASCGGALLLVDASQGVQAQTVANFYLAFSQGLELVPIINKVDLPSADPPRALEQISSTFELDPNNAVLVSAKTGLNVEAVLPSVVKNIPAYVYTRSVPGREADTCTGQSATIPNPCACF